VDTLNYIRELEAKLAALGVEDVGSTQAHYKRGRMDL